MNTEISRLRRLRQSALKVRALATVLDDGKSAGGIFERGALLSWRIARIATGRLRSHPYQSYQRDPSFFESGADRLTAILIGTVAGLRGHGAETFLSELHTVARELDDTRALTLSPDLSDALGRAQSRMRILVDDAQKQALLDAGMESVEGVDVDDISASSLSTSSYLAL